MTTDTFVRTTDSPRPCPRKPVTPAATSRIPPGAEGSKGPRDAASSAPTRDAAAPAYPALQAKVLYVTRGATDRPAAAATQTRDHRRPVGDGCGYQAGLRRRPRDLPGGR